MEEVPRWLCLLYHVIHFPLPPNKSCKSFPWNLAGKFSCSLISIRYPCKMNVLYFCIFNQRVQIPQKLFGRCLHRSGNSLCKLMSTDLTVFMQHLHWFWLQEWITMEVFPNISFGNGFSKTWLLSKSTSCITPCWNVTFTQTEQIMSAYFFENIS